MAIPDYQTLMLPLLKCLENGKEYPSSAIINKLAKEFDLTDEERQRIYPGENDKIIFNDRVLWARSYLKKAGLLVYPKKSYSRITKEGLKLLAEKPAEITNKFLMRYEDFRVFKGYLNNTENKNAKNNEKYCVDSPEITPDEMIADARELIQKHLSDELLDRILNQPPVFFEKMVARLLCAIGYGGSVADIIQSCGKSNDDGIDCIIKQDVLGLDQVHVQAKRYKSDNVVQVSAVRDFGGSLYNKKNPKGVFITTSSFSTGAVKYASKNDIILIDGKKLTELMIAYNVGVQVREKIEIKKIDEDFFMDDE